MAETVGRRDDEAKLTTFIRRVAAAASCNKFSISKGRTRRRRARRLESYSRSERREAKKKPNYKGGYTVPTRPTTVRYKHTHTYIVGRLDARVAISYTYARLCCNFVLCLPHMIVLSMVYLSCPWNLCVWPRSICTLPKNLHGKIKVNSSL